MTHSASDFPAAFEAWLQKVLVEGVPSDVAALSFNLFEPASTDGTKFAIELVGTGHFDANDPDWACDEVWAPEGRSVDIPVDFSGEDWEACLQRVRLLLAQILAEDCVPALRKVDAVGIGFVDGELHVVWPKASHGEVAGVST